LIRGRNTGIQQANSVDAGYENPKIAVEALLKAIKNPVIFEIGAHMGTDTLWFREITGSPAIHFFEPDPRNAKAIKDAGIDKIPGLFFTQAAIGNKSGESSFYMSTGRRPDPTYPYDHTDSSSLREPTQEMRDRFKWLSFKEEIKVKVLALDDYCDLKGIEHIDFIWADTQGAEVDMITGGQKTLAKTKYLFTEYCDIPMYKGQVSYEQILSMLPGKWKVLKKYVDDVLLQNLTLAS